MNALRSLLLSGVILLSACTDRITSINIKDSGTTPSGPTTPASCPTGFSTCSGPRFSDSGLTPSDTTFTISDKRHVKGLIYIPSGMSVGVLVRSALGCEASASTPQVNPTSVAFVYTVDVELQGISTCADSTFIKLAADSTVRKGVHVNVVSAPGIILNPPVSIGGIGIFGFYTCSTVGLVDTRCWFYSTNPLAVSIVQKDTTFASATAPWPTGFNAGGKYKNIAGGSANICAFSPVNPKIAKCATHTVGSSSPSMNLLMEPILYEWEVPDIIREMTKR